MTVNQMKALKLGDKVRVIKANTLHNLTFLVVGHGVSYFNRAPCIFAEGLNIHRFVAADIEKEE